MVDASRPESGGRSVPAAGSKLGVVVSARYAASLPMKKRKILKVAGLSIGILAILLMLFVVAFVFNPLEGSLADMRDVVPREVDFFVRKQRPAADFASFPEPVFWSSFTETSTWNELQKGPLVQGLKRDGFERLLQQTAEGVKQLRTDSGGWIDLMRDVLGKEVELAGYFEDRTSTPPKPLAEPAWCLYARVTWRVKVGCSVMRWGFVQSKAAAQGVDISTDGNVLVIKRGQSPPMYVARYLDCLMVTNSRPLLNQSLALSVGDESEESFGPTARYTDGVAQRLKTWAAANEVETPNAIEFSVSPNLTEGFRKFAANWPNPNHPDSMEQRVLASFLNLKGWNSISGALVFESEPERLSFTGEVVLNSHQLNDFQQKFFKEEQQERSKWLDPFLRMVPETACAAAALRMPAGEFMHAMFNALLQSEKDLIDDQLRRVSFQGTTLNGCRDLIDRIKVALLPRTGFVFHKNVPDKDIPVSNPSPVPQIAWVFWVKEGGKPVLEEMVRMLRTYSTSVFGFQRVFNLGLNLNLGPDAVMEFTNPHIPGTGSIATLLFRDFFILSNSGPLIKSIVRTRTLENARSIMDGADVRRFTKEMPTAVNGMVYLRGPELSDVVDGYRAFIEQSSKDMDPAWAASNRQRAEDEVRRSKYPQYATVAGIPEAMRNQFGADVDQHLREGWSKIGSGFAQSDLAAILQLRTMAKAMEGAYIQIELQPNYMRFQGKAILDYR